MTHGDLAKTFFCRNTRKARLVIRVEVTVQQGNGNTVYAICSGAAQCLSCGIYIHRHLHCPVLVQPLIYLEHAFIQQLGQVDL